MPRLLFLPGAGGRASFWQPVGDLLPPEWERHYFSWPGLGLQPSDPAVQGLEDLIGLVIAKLDQPADLIAQSMGALVALMVTLRAPEMVRRLVLTGPSSGVPVGDLGGADWRPDYRHEFPKASHWITEAGEDLSASLPSIQAPTLLLVGERDIISPPAVGEYLSGLLPDARVEIIAGGAHDFPETHAELVAAQIARHLG
jgi:pimeloyl-ACP methyl ester carboxylesterase